MSGFLRLNRERRVANLLFALLVAVYLGGLVVTIDDKLERVGRPDVGFQLDMGQLSPTREDASKAGLRFGGRVLRINEQSSAISTLRRGDEVPALRHEVGAQNVLTLEQADGGIHEVTIPVRPWNWHDVLFTEGATVVIGFLYFVVGVTAFLLRPYEIPSWALLTLCCFTGGVLTVLLVPFTPQDVYTAAYFLANIGILPFVIVHAALAFPVVHPLLLRFPAVMQVIYGFAALQVGYNFWSWYGPYAEEMHSRVWGSISLLVALLLFEIRCLQLSVRAGDRVVSQRARILLAGSVFGLGPVVSVNFFQQTFEILAIDNRLVYWPLALFLLALARVTLRPELLNARIAVRRAVMYASAVGVLTLVAILLSGVRPYAVALLLLPLLYYWPRFDERLNQRLYPKRRRIPELLRGLGDRLAAAEGNESVLEVLAAAPAQIGDAAAGVALLFSAGPGQGPLAVSSGPLDIGNPDRLMEEPLIQLVRATRKEVLRTAISVDPQYSNIKAECLACFDRLQAEVILPIGREHRCIGILALGSRSSGDAYEDPELDALSTLMQQAVQSLIRIEATERLRSRELEFADLKRFFPPQVIDQVMARGGAAELRTQRKQVTVLFADLRGFTQFSDSVEPEEVMATLAEYHNAMGRKIAEFSGTLERFVGDGFMVFFNDPVEQSDHIDRAVRMALAMRADICRLREDWERKGYRIDVGMGIHTGYATCGFIGYEGRRDYGVIGNTTNLAARLSDAAGPGEILTSARVRAALVNGFRLEAIGELQLKGFHQPQGAFRLLDHG